MPRHVWLLLFAATSAACSSDPPTPEPGDACEAQAAGTACTWLGLPGHEGFNGDELPRYETQVNQVQDLVFLADGRALLSDFNNHLVREVGSDGVVRAVIGWTDPIFPGDGPMGIVPEGGAPGTEWQLFHPSGMLVDANGAVVVVAWHNHKLLTFDPDSGLVNVLAGGGPDGGGAGFGGDEGPAEEALFEQPSDAAVDDDGNIYVVDQLNQRIRMIDTEGIIHTFAGTGDKGDAGDGGPAGECQLAWADGSNPNPSGAVLHHEGKLYVADTENHRIRVIDLATGIIDAFAGTGSAGYSGDGGPATDAELQGPRDMAVGPDDVLYVADTDNGAVRAVDLATGTISTVVGTGELGLDEVEQLPASQTHLRRPFGVAVDAEGDLYVMDTLNSRIVKVKR
jgi:DNA-binding beta-propeller fold protein YncE